MMGLRSIFANCFQVRGLVFLQKTMIIGESNVVPGSKRTFYDVLEGFGPRNSSKRQPQSLIFLFLCFDSR